MRRPHHPYSTPSKSRLWNETAYSTLLIKFPIVVRSPPGWPLGEIRPQIDAFHYRQAGLRYNHKSDRKSLKPWRAHKLVLSRMLLRPKSPIFIVLCDRNGRSGVPVPSEESFFWLNIQSPLRTRVHLKGIRFQLHGVYSKYDVGRV